ncbi:hypothetical protein R9C00_17860 [Flammeovirgaceae bacterium SG7u.111]|nr:hypothetical protein [Flammeovirgaceae bacterium SG7u.132]WPO33570.1 hypothetical protein R9C00_17860 [Flammeovirgaceae bacterium SG7u.111]
MKRILIFLSLCASLCCISYSPIQNLTGTEDASLDVEQHEQGLAFLSQSSATDSEVHLIIEETEIEEEEEECIHLKKSTESNFITTIFYAQGLSKFFFIKNSLPSYKPYSFIPSYKLYLTLQVIRI